MAYERLLIVLSNLHRSNEELLLLFSLSFDQFIQLLTLIFGCQRYDLIVYNYT